MESDFNERSRVLLETAQQLFEQKPDWVCFFREIFGPDGALHKLFPDDAELKTFQESNQHRTIQQMLADLKANQGDPEPSHPKTITVRMPAVIHKSLIKEAKRRDMSMNALCLQWIVDGLSHPHDP